MGNKISIKGLDKAEVLAALYNAAKPQGMGMLQYDPTPMTKEQAQNLLKQSTSFDYLKGRVMKINIKDDEIDVWGYDRDNGVGTAEKVISALSKSGETHSAEIHDIHVDHTRDSIEDLKNQLHDESSMNGNVVHMGFSDAAHVLKPAMERIGVRLDF